MGVRATMPACPLSSFLETPIFFLTVQVRFGLPVLGDEKAPAILRDAWLRSAVRDHWFVGQYRVLPDRVSLLACPGRAAQPVNAWVAVWKAVAAVRIKQVTGGHGPLWEFGAPPEPVVSVVDYEARCAALRAEPVGLDQAGAFVTGGTGGMLWQLRSAGLPASVPAMAR